MRSVQVVVTVLVLVTVRVTSVTISQFREPIISTVCRAATASGGAAICNRGTH
jgi:hypothetical protein